MSLPPKCSLSPIHKMSQNMKSDKLQNMKMHKNVSKKCHFRGGLISALKPGPVVPPGTQKVPNQAARISQSVKKCHLSDILAIFRGGHFFHYFLCFFTFQFYHFFTFSVFLFLCFFTFSGFLNFTVFVFC